MLAVIMGTLISKYLCLAFESQEKNALTSVPDIYQINTKMITRLLHRTRTTKFYTTPIS